MIIAVMSVYQEEDLIARAIQSLWDGGVNEIHVFDGAWRGFSGEEPGASTDKTIEIAGALNCTLHLPMEIWSSQEAKRTAMFERCDASEDDHILVFDADEELEGQFPVLAPGQHYNLMVRCVGPNDMPGIRGEWPNGDYFAGYKPELRLFAYDEMLHCKWPGGYWDSEGRIEPYANGSGDPLLPVVDGVSFLHHGNDRSQERIAQKISFYEEEHKRRHKIQAAEWQKQPW